jgi:nucleotide-binding universal stress UspA family protein
MEMKMFKHILLPTDGSPTSGAAIAQGIRFAQEIQAKVTGVHVIPNYHVLTSNSEMLEDTREQYAKDSREHALKYLEAIETAAKQSGVDCDTAYVISDHPYEAILNTADDRGCDLIAMASHGRKGVSGFLMGSETQKVLSHSKKPVLVLR